MESHDGRDWIDPVEKYGVRMLSIGFLVDKEKPVLWRGGMASNALNNSYPMHGGAIWTISSSICRRAQAIFI